MVAVGQIVPAVVHELCTRHNAQLESFLGAGAFKSAYRVIQGSDPFALKVALVNASAAQRLEREVDALKACDHPNIARLVHTEIFRFENQDYLVLVEEYLQGGTLEARLAAGRLSKGDIKNIAMPLACALRHLQSLNLVHRDIKPANILFRENAEPVLTDFGLVRVLGEPSLTHDFLPQGPGTPLYSSPEQLCNDKASIDWRSDQFGLALVLAECALGSPPFAPSTGDLTGAVYAVARRECLPVAAAQQLSQLGWNCLNKALSPWPVQRFRTPTDFIDALGAV